MTGGWAMVSRDPDAHRWQEMCLYAFLATHSEAMTAAAFPLADSLKSEYATFERIGYELWILEWDLAACLNELKAGSQRVGNLKEKKFSIVYHTDNFNARVYKLIEDVYALLALLGGRDPIRRLGEGEPPRQRFVETLLEETGRHSIKVLVQGFRNHTLIKDAVVDRNRFVHSWRDEADAEWRWRMLAPVTRIHEYDDDDEIARKLRRITDPPHVDDYADEKADHLFNVLGEIRQFRDGLYGALLADAAHIVERSEGARQRFQSVVAWDETWRALQRPDMWKSDESGPDSRNSDGEPS